MVIFEALNALAGDCLLLRYSGQDARERLWIVDGGPKSEANITVWRDVLLPRLEEISRLKPLPVALGMVSHIDDDHINGIQKLTSTLVAARAGQPAAVRFERFWFNSFEQLVGRVGLSGEATTASLQSLVGNFDLLGMDGESAQLIMQSVPQAINLATDLRSLHLEGNSPINGFVMARKGQRTFPIDEADVTIIGPLENRIEALRKEWAKALKKPTKRARQAALQALFMPARSQDKSVPNLSSIVVLVEVRDRKLLLTGDAHGDDIVKAWTELGLSKERAAIDLLKMPHHGSIRNTTETFLNFFQAKHYVFSADGKHDNPDPQTVEALVKLQGHREISLAFTNANVTWSKTYKLEKGGASVRNLEDLLAALRDAYPGPWLARTRRSEDKSITVELT